MRQVPIRLYGLALLSAILQILPFPLAGPVPAWRRLFCWICLVPLLLALAGRNRKGDMLRPSQAASVGYLSGVAWYMGNCYWIYQTMFLYGGLPSPVALGILILFSLYLGLYLALFGACYAMLQRFLGRGPALFLSPVLWVVVELARSRVTGFPWDLLGYTQVDDPWLNWVAPWAGVMGISLLLAAGNALWLWKPAFLSNRLRWCGPVVAISLLTLSYLGMQHRLPPTPASATAILVQDNLSVGAEAHGPPESDPELLHSLTDQTFHPEISPPVAAAFRNPGNSQTPEDSTARLPAPQLVVWPEAPTDFESSDPHFRQAIAAVARTTQAPVIADAVAIGTQLNAQGRYDEFVSASFFLPDGTYAGRYDKMHLVPFGEYTPYKQLFFFAGHLLDGLNFVPGTRRTLFSAAGHRYGVFLCYESIFGDEIREFAEKGAQAFVNLSDDGWYGDTSAPWEHLDMARMRAIENHRWLLLDTNTGLTSSIDPEGRIVASMPRHIRGAVDVPFGYLSDLTFYTRHGDWIAWLSALVVISALLGGALQRRHPYRPAETK